MNTEHVNDPGTAPEQTDIEQQARAAGWKPREEYAGQDFVEAKEYLGRKPLYDRISQQSKKIKEMELAIEGVKGVMGGVQAERHQEAIQKLYVGFQQLIRDGAPQEEIDKVAAEIRKHSEAMQQVPKRGKAAPVEFTEWVTENQWFDNKSEDFDLEMAVYARDKFDQYAKLYPGDSLENGLKHLDKQMRKQFPDFFGIRPKQPKVENEDREPTSGPATRGSSPLKPGYRNLSQQQKQVCDAMARRGLITREAYVQHLIDSGDLK